MVFATVLVLVVGAFPFVYRYAAWRHKLLPFQGHWDRIMVAGFREGFHENCMPLFVIEGDKVTCQCRFGSEEIYLIDRLDPTQNPPWIDLFLVQSPHKPPYKQVGPMKGVYRFDGDTLTIAFDVSRPKEVSATFGQGTKGTNCVLVLRRVR
jgi:uncharacterized protein (TIGR03067 family)